MKKLLFILLLLPSMSIGQEVTTNNQLPQQFFNNNQPHNEWTCTDPTHNHGNNIGAMVNGDHMMHPGVSLADDVGMSEAQIQNGWESELGADIWHWNTSTSTTTMTQTITDNLGNVTTQTRQVILNSCGYTNCGSYGTYTDTHVQGSNSATDFQIAVRFDFTESTGRSSHWAVDIKNPTLKITYEDSPQPQISQETLTQLENVDTQIETAIDMLENEEIGGTTFTEMVEDIIVDSGLDMELTMGFVEPEMNMEEQFYIDDAVEVDTVEQNINDEMAGVLVLAPTDMEFDEPEMESPTVEMSVDMEMPDMEMPEPSFTEMAEETFTNAIDTLAEMFDMDMPEDMSTEAATEIMDAMVEEDMPEMGDGPVETVAMNEEPEMETTEPESNVEMERPEPEPTMEEEPEPTGGSQSEPTTEEAPVEETPTEDTSTTNDTPVESAEETTVAEADTDTSVSTSSVDTTVETDVKNISIKIEKIIAKVNSKLKRVADKVRASQLVTLKGMQIDGPKLSNYTERTFYKDREMFGGNLDLFQDINTLAQQPIYANADLGYQKDDPLNIQRKVLNEINYEKNKIYLELKELRGN